MICACGWVGWVLNIYYYKSINTCCLCLLVAGPVFFMLLPLSLLLPGLVKHPFLALQENFLHLDFLEVFAKQIVHASFEVVPATQHTHTNKNTYKPYTLLPLLNTYLLVTPSLPNLLTTTLCSECTSSSCITLQAWYNRMISALLNIIRGQSPACINNLGLGNYIYII